VSGIQARPEKCGLVSASRLFFFVLVLSLLVLAGCKTVPSQHLSRFEFSQPHMGTLWRITLYASDAASASNAVRSAFARVRALDQIMTDYDPDSELERLRKYPVRTPVKVSDDLFDVVQRSQEFSRQTKGAFDITVGLEVQLWRRARRQRALPAEDRLAAARRAVGYEKLRLDPHNRTATLLADNIHLDLGGIAKGYGADAALRVLRQMGLRRALVAASGDLAIGDPPPGKRGWRVGIGAVGGRAGDLAEQLTLCNVGVSTSGDLEQFVELNGTRYSHIVDPRTGMALTNRIQATVIADCATRSDALATSVCVLGADAGMKLIDADRRTAALILVPGAGANSTALKSRRFLSLEPPAL
jgi:FAD:protein FMN transferase